MSTKTKTRTINKQFYTEYKPSYIEKELKKEFRLQYASVTTEPCEFEDILLVDVEVVCKQKDHMAVRGYLSRFDYEF